MSNKRQYVYDTSNGTVVPLEHAVIVELDEETLEAVLENEQDAPRGQKVDDPFQVISFSATAIREHFEGADNGEFIEGLTDDDLTEAGEWAINGSFLWDAVHSAWEFGVETVRAEREAGLSGPI